MITDNEGTQSNDKLSHHGPLGSKKWLQRIANTCILECMIFFGAQTSPVQFIQEMAPSPLEPAFEFCRSISRRILFRTRPWLRRASIVQQRWSMFSDPKNYNQRFEAIISFKNDTKVSWWSPDFGSMSGWEKRRNRRLQLYLEGLMMDEDMAAGHEHLCHCWPSGMEKMSSGSSSLLIRRPLPILRLT